MNTKTANNSQPTCEQKLIMALGRCGHFLHVRGGGQGGKPVFLCHIDAHGGSISQRELIEHFRLKSATVSETLSKLEAEGLVTREKNEADRRQVTVKLTKAGRAKAKKYFAERKDFEEKAFDTLSKKDKEQLLKLLGRVLERWGELA